MLDRLNATDVSCVVYGLAKIGYSPGADALVALEERAVQLGPAWNAKDLALTVWGFARFDHFPGEQNFPAFRMRGRSERGVSRMCCSLILGFARSEVQEWTRLATEIRASSTICEGIGTHLAVSICGHCRPHM